ncbi:peptidase M23 [Kitasatospora sp. NPDC004723]|uniref:peptidase M23 n=1 Tax=Kitasatospora sp. NPDC004723 TaxID=3154288 RepID=UPI00339FC21C
MDSRDAARVARALTQVAGRGAMVKVGGVVAVVFLILLVILGLLGATTGGTAAAAGSSCGGRGVPGAPQPGSGPAPPGPVAEGQVTNAMIIDGVAVRGGLPGRATLIALMTALQESSLVDLAGGDRDSIGLFQQRPSQGWGTVEQILHHPDYQAHMFFFGGDSGDPPGLTDIKGWQLMPYGAAAQAVQRSAYPDLYDRHEQNARRIAAQAGIDLERAGTATGTNPGTGTSASPSNPTDCYPETPGTPGTPFHDASSPWPAEVKNPRSTADTIAWARNEVATGGPDWRRRCLAFVAAANGWHGAGYTNPPANTHSYATELYTNMIPLNMHHDKDRNPPPGALLFWDTGSDAGHVALYVGNGQVASSDILRPGYIDIVPAEQIETKWNAVYLGWAPPYFPAGG